MSEIDWDKEKITTKEWLSVDVTQGILFFITSENYFFYRFNFSSYSTFRITTSKCFRIGQKAYYEKVSLRLFLF